MTNPITVNSTKTVTSIIRNGTAIEKMMLAWEWQPQGLFLGDVQAAWYDPVNTANSDWRRNMLSPSNAVGGVSFFANPISKNASGPDGSANSAYTLIAKNPGGSDQVAVSVSLNGLATETTHTFSMFLKNNGLGWGTVYLTTFESTITFRRAYFDLVNGQVGTVDPIYSGYGIEPAGNGFFRCWVSFKTISIQNGIFNIGIAEGNNDALVPLDGASSIIIADLQLEVGSNPTAYQPITDVDTEVRALFPKTTIFQDNNGLLPAAVASATTSQTVGLWLDKSKDLALGSDLVTNGNFAAGINGWVSFVATIAENNGRLQVTPTDGSSRSGYQGITTVVGKLYKVTAKYDQGTTTGVLFRVRNNAANSTIVYTSITFTGSGTAEFSFMAGATISILELATATVNTGNSAYFDDISVREVLGNHAVQTSTALRPLFGRAPISRRNLFIRTEEFSNAYWIRFGLNLGASITAPDGSKVYLLTETTGSGTRGLRPTSLSGLITTAPTHTLSYIVKSNGRRYCNLVYATNNNTQIRVGFDLQDGVISGPLLSSITNVTGTASITSMGDGFYRISMTATGLPTSNVYGPLIYLSATGLTDIANQDTQNTYTGDGVSGLYVGSAQFELGSVATPYQKVVTALDITEAGKSYAFIRPDLSDDKLTTNMASTKNLLRYTEEFDNALWTKQYNNVVIPNATIAPDGTLTADKLIESPATQTQRFYQSVTSPAAPRVFSVYMKKAERSWALLEFANGAFAFFNLATGEVGATGGTGITATISAAPNGFYRCELRISTTGGIECRISVTTGNSVFSYYGNGTSGIFLWGAQLEVGSAATAYEYGGFKGDVVVAGKNGSVYQTDVVSPTGIMDLGPTTYTGGTTGILRAVGDVVGYTMAKKKFSDIEKAQLVRYYKKRGAKGLLVPGPNLVVNGDFSNGLTGWTTTSPNGTFEIINGVLRITATQTSPWPVLSRNIPYTLGRYHLLVVNLKNASIPIGYGQAYLAATRGGATQFAAGYYPPAPIKEINLATTNNAAFLEFRLGVSKNAGNPSIGEWIELSSVELYELRPEEEW